MNEPPIAIAAFYKFMPLSGISEIKDYLLPQLKSLEAKGSILLANEGINGTIAAKREKLAVVMSAIAQACGTAALEHKISFAEALPFLRLKVRLKKEIVTIGPVKANPNELVGEYVEPGDWNALISEPDVLVVDARNDYEFRVGTFKNAIDPHTESFSQFPRWARENLPNKKARIAMFCTGGIRCEKASSFLRHEGFENVYHLKGGILKYLEDVPREQSLWQGACYVFDERVAVEHGLAVSDFTTCHGCLEPVSAEERKSTNYEEGVCCPRCADRLSPIQKASNRERQRQFDLAKLHGRRHLGPAREEPR